MIRTLTPLPNNLYAKIGSGAIRLIHIDEFGHVAILWFKKHKSGVGLEIERFGRFAGRESSHRHWLNSSYRWAHVKHVKNFDAESLSDDDAWKMVTDLFGYDACMEAVNW